MLEGRAAEGVHGMAGGAIPAVKKMPANLFAQMLSGIEIALGGALLLSFVLCRILGAALAGVSAGLIQLYLTSPQDGGLRPIPDEHRPGQGGVAAWRWPHALAGPGPVAEAEPGLTMTPKTRAEPVAVGSVSGEEKPSGVRIDSGGHALRGDEPASDGDGETGPAPFGLLLCGLGACTAITVRMYAERKQRPLSGVDVALSFLAPDRSLDDEQRAELAEIAEKDHRDEGAGCRNRDPHDDPAGLMRERCQEASSWRYTR
jgi:putative redox protein